MTKKKLVVFGSPDFVKRYEELEAVAKLASELCDAVDEDAEDIGGHRPVHVILGELGPAVDKVMPR